MTTHTPTVGRADHPAFVPSTDAQRAKVAATLTAARRTVNLPAADLAARTGTSVTEAARAQRLLTHCLKVLASTPGPTADLLREVDKAVAA